MPPADPAPDNGTPSLAAPPGAVDCHFHIFLHKCRSVTGRTRAESTVDDYLNFRSSLGISRSVIIAPSTYGTDNTCLFEALDVLPSGTTRAVVILADDLSSALLDDYHRRGVRGVRLYAGHGDLNDEVRLKRIARVVQDRGWHLQLVGEQTAQPFARYEARLAELPCVLVFDHFGFAPQPDALNSDTANALRRLLERGRTYVKLSGMYIQSRTGPPRYDDFDALAIDLLRQAPERMLWGSDWPHTMATVRPDGQALLGTLATWAPSLQAQQQVLCGNPDRLYWAA